MQNRIKELISANKVMIFSKSYCPHCDKVKALFKSINVPFNAMELDNIEEGSSIQSELVSMTGQRTVPSVFINGKHIGGNDDTQTAYKNGSLAKMLA